MKVLRYLNSLDNEVSNIRRFSNVSGIARTTIKDNIDRLILKRLAKKPNDGSYVITKKGKELLKASNPVGRVSDSLRSPCRKEALSTHYFKYTIKIKKIDRSRLKELNANNIKLNKLPNFTEYYLYFDDCTITIKLNQIIIHIHDLIAQDTEEAHFQAFHKCMAYVISLRKIADLEGLRVFSKPHYARVESYLSKKISKIDNKYKLTFQDGTSFWIDWSDKREDETDNALYRDRIDEIFLDAKDSKSTFSDVDRHDIDLDKIKEVLLLQIKLESEKNKGQIVKEAAMPSSKEIADRSYFG